MTSNISRKAYFGLGRVPVGIGAIVKGFDITEKEFRDPRRLPVVDFRAMTARCPHNCFHCFTDKRNKTLTLDQIKNIIDQAAEIKAKGMLFLGEGEPTLDNDFFEIISYTAKKNIQPIVATDGATKLRDVSFVKKINKVGASVFPKCDSLFNAEYQNWVVQDKTGQYFAQRNEAVRVLIQEGFNTSAEDGTTRLGFDMVVSTKNISEVGQTLRYCRKNNIGITFSFFLPAGRSGMENFNKSYMVSEKEKTALRETVKMIDEKEFGYKHQVYTNFVTAPCLEFIQIYGNGKVSACPGNEETIGYIQNESLSNLRQSILETFPKHCSANFDGNCPYI